MLAEESTSDQESASLKDRRGGSGSTPVTGESPYSETRGGKGTFVL